MLNIKTKLPSTVLANIDQSNFFTKLGLCFKVSLSIQLTGAECSLQIKNMQVLHLILDKRQIFHKWIKGESTN